MSLLVTRINKLIRLIFIKMTILIYYHSLAKYDVIQFWYNLQHHPFILLFLQVVSNNHWQIIIAHQLHERNNQDLKIFACVWWYQMGCLLHFLKMKTLRHYLTLFHLASPFRNAKQLEDDYWWTVLNQFKKK